MGLRQGLNPGRLGKAAISASVGTAVVVAFFALFAFQSGDIGLHQTDMTYHSLDYDVTVRPDGDMRITEHIDMKLDRRSRYRPWRQLFQRYTLHDDVNSDGVLSAITGHLVQRHQKRGHLAMGALRWQGVGHPDRSVGIV